MRLPTVQGVIDRRVLVNYRVDPAVLSRLLPPPFRPKLVGGHAMAGICLIRLKHVRPAFLPLSAGAGSENAAHRFAVEWERYGQRCQGVFVPRRDTNSRLNTLLGGRLFPGEHHRAHFEVYEKDNHFQISVQSNDGLASVRVSAHTTAALPSASIFKSIDDASRFFEAGALGYSPTHDAGRYDGLELCCKSWAVQALEVEAVQSSFFDDLAKFPPGSAVFDCALLMRNIAHTWHTREPVCCEETAAV